MTRHERKCWTPHLLNDIVTILAVLFRADTMSDPDFTVHSPRRQAGIRIKNGEFER
jgi:hypothetical protein